MRLCILSDSHGSTNRIEQLLEREPNCDAFIHLGDYSEDAKYLIQLTPKPVYAVKGNCDLFERTMPDERIETLDGKTFILCHGHTRGVKRSLYALSLYAQEIHVDAALFGHTHIPHCEEVEGVLLLNPGSLMNLCYAVLEISGDRITSELKHL